MAHKIGIHDLQEGRHMGWHGLTKVRDDIPVGDNWLSKWDVEKRPMIDPDGKQSEYCRVTCTDDPSLYIGDPVHNTSYSLISNEQLLEIVNDCLLSVKGARIETVGSVCDRGRVFVSVSIPDLPEFRAGGREFRAYLNFINSHDRSSPFVVNASNICVVCDNTFRYNLTDQNNKVFRATIRHTKNAHSRLNDIDGMIDAYVGTQVRFKHLMDTMDSKHMSVRNAEEFFAGLSAPRVEEPSTQLMNKINRLTYLFGKGRGNSGETRADAFSAVTDYFTHESSGGDNINKQIASSEFGFGADVKTDALEILTDDGLLNTTISRGASVLALA